MSDVRVDCVVVGARCAGAPLATHLARAGLEVMLLDAASMPSDQPMSTHVIQPFGMDFIDELGLGKQIRECSPPIRTLRMDVAGRSLHIRFLGGRSAHCLRRSFLDRMLQETAVSAGAVLRDRTVVLGVLEEAGRVVGVETEHRGKRERIFARYVVGADGRHSSIAKHVRSREYFGFEDSRSIYWAYWPAPPKWRHEAPYSEFEAYTGFERGEIDAIFQTDGDLLLIASTTSVANSTPGDHEQAYLRKIGESPLLGPLVEGLRPASKILGLKKARFFFREPVGPGWALVGDAGLHVHPAPGQGITDALRDARTLARAIIRDTDRALIGYWRKRDLDSYEIFKQAEEMGTVDFANPFNQLIWEHASDPVVARRMALAADRHLSPYDVVPLSKVLLWVAGALARGRRDVLPFFLAAGKRNQAIAVELKKQRELSAAVE